MHRFSNNQEHGSAHRNQIAPISRMARATNTKAMTFHVSASVKTAIGQMLLRGNIELANRDGRLIAITKTWPLTLHY